MEEAHDDDVAMDDDAAVDAEVVMEDVVPDLAAMNYRELQKACKDLGLPARGKTEVLRKQLEDYYNDPEGTLKKMAKDKVKKDRGWIDWQNSAAREIMMEDLEPGGWLYGEDDLDAKLVYDVYKSRQEEFSDVPFDQFEARYNDATKKAAKRRARSALEEEYLHHDRQLYPRKSHNHRGEPVFDMDTEAKMQLREDIKNKLHKSMSPMELHEFRTCYMKYKLCIFRPRIYQEVHRNKFLNHLEKQRKKKRKEYAVNTIKAKRKKKKKKKKKEKSDE